MAITTWLAQIRRHMRRGWFARGMAQLGTTRSFRVLEHDARTFARQRTRHIPFPRLRFVFLPLGAANFALTEDAQLAIQRKCAWPSRLWAHLTPLLCISGALSFMMTVRPLPILGILTFFYPVISLFVYLIMWLESKTGLLGIIGKRWDVANVLVRQAEESRQTFLAEDMMPFSLSVGELMGQRLADLEVELFGPKSRFHEAQRQMSAHHARALRLLERQKVRIVRIVGNTPLHLVSLRDATQEIVDRYATALQKLDTFCASVGAYLDECRAQVSGLVAEVGDLEIARKVSALQRQITQDEQTAILVVSETLTRLQDGMTALRRDVLARERVACEIAGELPHASDIGEELDHLESVLEGLVPSRTPARVRA